MFSELRDFEHELINIAQLIIFKEGHGAICPQNTLKSKPTLKVIWAQETVIGVYL